MYVVGVFVVVSLVCCCFSCVVVLFFLIAVFVIQFYGVFLLCCFVTLLFLANMSAFHLMFSFSNRSDQSDQPAHKEETAAYQNVPSSETRTQWH